MGRVDLLADMVRDRGVTQLVACSSRSVLARAGGAIQADRQPRYQIMSSYLDHSRLSAPDDICPKCQRPCGRYVEEFTPTQNMPTYRSVVVSNCCGAELPRPSLLDLMLDP